MRGKSGKAQRDPQGTNLEAAVRQRGAVSTGVGLQRHRQDHVGLLLCTLPKATWGRQSCPSVRRSPATLLRPSSPLCLSSFQPCPTPTGPLESSDAVLNNRHARYCKMREYRQAEVCGDVSCPDTEWLRMLCLMFISCSKPARQKSAVQATAAERARKLRSLKG